MITCQQPSGMILPAPLRRHIQTHRFVAQHRFSACDSLGCQLTSRTGWSSDDPFFVDVRGEPAAIDQLPQSMKKHH